MATFTQQQVNDFYARVEKTKFKHSDYFKDGPGSVESDLHDQISNYCRSKGWYYVHSRMDRKSTNGIGTADFLIFMDGGRAVAIEAKRAGRKPTREQLMAQAQLRHLGHTSEIVYSFEQFLTIVTADNL